MTMREPRPGQPVPPPVKVPWLLRAPSAAALTPADREHDRVAAATTRRTALRLLPVVGLVWIVVAVVGSDFALRTATVVALALSVVLGGRAAVTTQRFRRRWMDPDEVLAPPRWVTLMTIAAMIFAVVAVLNLANDVMQDRSATGATVLSMLFAAMAGAGVAAHLSGGRSVGAALQSTDDQSAH